MPASAVDAREHMRNFSVEEFDTGQDSVVLCSAGRDIDLRFRASFNTATREVTGIQLGSVEVRTRAMASRNAHLLGLRPGDVVKHARFGLGVIRALVGEGERSEAVVEFESRRREASTAGLGSTRAGIKDSSRVNLVREL